MFQVIHDRAGTTKQIILRDDSSGESVSILPGFGANINELVLHKDGALHSVIDGNETAGDFTKKNLFKSATLFPFPNRIRDGAYTFEGKHYQLPLNYPEEHNACHGFVYDKCFTVENTVVGNDRAEAILVYRYDGSLAGYPFPCLLRMVFTLRAGAGFSCGAAVENTGTGPMPMGHGWHPLLTLHKQVNELSLMLPAADRIEVDEHLVPTGTTAPYTAFATPTPIGETVFDTCFRLNGSGDSIQATELSDPKKNIRIRLWQETGLDAYNYLQLFIPPDRQSIAVEPMTCSINAFNNHEGLIVLPPGALQSACYGVALA